MNKQLEDFYLNNGTDDKERTLEFILAQDDEWWEFTHDFIQWVFPTATKSGFNPNAPLLIKDSVMSYQPNNLNDNYNFERSCLRFVRFLELDSDKPWWVDNAPHNYLRITRFLESIKIVLLRQIAYGDLYTPDMIKVISPQLKRIAENNPNDLLYVYNNYWAPAGGLEIIK